MSHRLAALMQGKSLSAVNNHVTEQEQKSLQPLASVV